MNQDYIGKLPGLIKDGDDTYTDVLAALGLTTLTPMPIGDYNDGRNVPPIASLNINGSEYSLKSVLEAIGAVLTRFVEKTGYGILSGLEVAEQDTPDMTVSIAAGIRYKADGTRQTVAAILAQAITAADTVKDRTDIIYVNSAGVAIYLAGIIEIDAVAGARSYTITTNAAATDTITIGGQTFTAVDADPAAGQFIPGESATTCATALAAVIGANATLAALYTITNPSAGVVRLVETVAGGLNNPGAATKTGTVVIASGTLTSSVAHVAGGTAPAVPSGGINIAEINVDANQTIVETADIHDKRVWTAPGVA
jgi:hypothetical protein